MGSPEVLMLIFLFFSIAIPIIIFLTGRHRERMAMIEKGLSGEMVKAFSSRPVRHDPLLSLKWGLLFLMGGLGVLTGNYLQNTWHVNDGAVVGVVVLFVGIGLVGFYFLAGRNGASGSGS
jgi:hypothetical protein